MAFSHRDLFVVKSTLLCGVVPMDMEGADDLDDNDHTLLGYVGEEKKGTQSLRVLPS